MSQSLARALRILVDLGEGERSLDDLTGEHGVHKTTVLRLLRTMEAEGFVRRDGAHRFQLGPRLFAIADAAREQWVILRVAAPHLRELNRSTGQTIHLAAYESGQVIYIDKLDTVHTVRMYSKIGVPAAMHCTAVGKVLLAALPEAARAAHLAAIEYHRYTDRTIGGADELRAELDRVRAQGWAEDHAEHESFINCIAAPVSDGTGRVVAAASISVPDLVLSHQQLLDLLPRLLETTAAIGADYR